MTGWKAPVFIMLFVTLFAAMIFLSGCTRWPPKANTTEGTGGEANPPAGFEAAPGYPYVNTSGLSFERNASGVMNANTTFPERETLTFSDVSTPDGRLIVYYFYSSSCSACKALWPEIVRLESEYAGVEWKKYDITTQNGTYAYQDFAAEYNLSSKQRLVPQMLVNGTIITDRFNINRSIEGILTAFASP